jgi:hypothetical protein
MIARKMRCASLLAAAALSLPLSRPATVVRPTRPKFEKFMFAFLLLLTPPSARASDRSDPFKKPSCVLRKLLVRYDIRYDELPSTNGGLGANDLGNRFIRQSLPESETGS